ncbi:MAG: 16S rRNA (cytidine(1402)-2'-O)-methyltransferase [Myxococcota bacterium]
MTRRKSDDAHQGRLFVIALPIGHPDDLSPHAREILGQVSRIACEDTRVTRRVLQRQGIPIPSLVSYHDHNEQQRVPGLVAALQGGDDVALVSDAGTPLIADPGYRLVVAAIAAGIEVRSIPGPCAAIAALAVSGLPSDRFLVLGFLPRDGGGRRAVLTEHASTAASLVLYAAPHRFLALLEDLSNVLGPQRRIAVANDLTKTYERWWRGSVATVAQQLADHELKGELTVVVEGASRRSSNAELDSTTDQLIAELVATGLSAGSVRDVVAKVFDLPRRDVYQRVLHHQHRLEEE